MLSLGIDCAQLTHAFCLMDESKRVLVEGTFPETGTGLAHLRTQLAAHGEPEAVTLEASGSCWQNLHAALRALGWPAAAVDPVRARRYAQLRHPRHKTDKADARTLAEMGLEAQRASFPASEAELEAHGLTRVVDLRVRLIGQLHALVVVANPALVACGWELGVARSVAVLRRYPTTLHLRRARGLAQVRFGPRQKVGEEEAKELQEAAREALCGAVLEAHAAEICFLAARIAECNAQIARLEAALTKRLPEAVRLDDIKGVGPRTALVVCACVPWSALTSAKQAAAYAGLHPHRFESNGRARTRLSKQGDAVVRTALYRAAFPASQHNPVFKACYDRLRDHGLTHRQALCGVAHKLLRVCYALLRDESDFSADHAPPRAGRPAAGATRGSGES
jgi:transposase